MITEADREHLKTLPRLEEQLAYVVAEAIKRAIAPLETRIKELEARPIVKDAGVWKSGELYHEGAVVSHGGSGWICRSMHYSTGTEPSHTDFRLFVKAGRDGKTR